AEQRPCGKSRVYGCCYIYPINNNQPKTFMPFIKKTAIAWILVFSSFFTYAQDTKEVRGVLQDSTGLSVISATLKLVSGSDTLYEASDVDGIFSFKKIKNQPFTLYISNLGYET